MKQEIKKLWVKALRSGKYKQGKYALRVGNEFCCLGVLCDLHRKEVKGVWRKEEAAPNRSNYCGASVYLPLVVALWAEIPGSPKVFGYRLSEWNDGSGIGQDTQGKTFLEIADIIEGGL